MDKTETVGTVHPHLEVKLVDSEGNTVPRMTPGEIMTKGYVVRVVRVVSEASGRCSRCMRCS